MIEFWRLYYEQTGPDGFDWEPHIPGYCSALYLECGNLLIRAELGLRSTRVNNELMCFAQYGKGWVNVFVVWLRLIFG